MGITLLPLKELNFIFNQPKGNILWGVSALTLFWNYVHLGKWKRQIGFFRGYKN